MSLLAKLGLALATIGLLPLAAISWQLVDMNREALTEQVLRLHGVTARTVAARVESHLAGRAIVTASLAGNRLLVDDPRAPAAAEQVRVALEAEPDLASVAYVTPARETYLRAQRRDLAPAVLDAMLAATPAVPSTVRADGALWVTVAAPAPDGLILTAWNGERLEELIRPDEIGDQAAIELADGSSAVIAGTRGTLDALPASLVEAARSGLMSGAGRFRDAAGRVVLGAYAPVAGTPWFVVSSQPIEVAERLAADMRRRALVAVAATVILAAVLLGVAYRSTVRPIRELVRSHADLVADAGGRGDEVAQLRAAFAALDRLAKGRRDDAREPVRLGRYEVHERIGAGGAGMVFRAVDPVLRRPVAIKTFRTDEVGDVDRGALVQALLDEAVNLAGFTHPNIVTVYDVANAEDVAFVAMELVDGVSLDAYLALKGRLRPEQVIVIGAAIARALEAAHEKHLVHGDIKPGNVLLGRDGSIKVADFGLAHALTALKGSRTHVFGTPGFIAPELLRGEPSDDRIDMFALGVVLYRCLCGRLPFDGGTVADVFRKTMEGRYASMSELGAEAGPELESVVTTLLESDPEARLLRAGAVASLLERLAARQRIAWTAPADLMAARARVAGKPWLPLSQRAPSTVHHPGASRFVERPPAPGGGRA